MPSNSFLEWFIGFVEGDGSFVMFTEDGDVGVSAAQGVANPKVIAHIQKTLGFGNIYAKNCGGSQWQVAKFDHVRALVLLFNGNMVLPTREKRFKAFLAAYNAKKHSTAILHIDRTLLPTLHDQWLHGFTCA